MEGFIFALSIEVLKSFIFALLLDGHVQIVKSWKISSSLYELKDFLLAISIDVIEDFISYCY